MEFQHKLGVMCENDKNCQKLLGVYIQAKFFWGTNTSGQSLRCNELCVQSPRFLRANHLDCCLFANINHFVEDPTASKDDLVLRS